MTAEQQRILIAEACGWKLNPSKSPRDLPWGCAAAFPNWEFVHQLPDYLNDLNAMNEAETILNTSQLDRYADILCDIVASGDPDPNIIELIRLSAAQRAEAFLRALKLKEKLK
jgi:hypothetical protein